MIMSVSPPQSSLFKILVTVSQPRQTPLPVFDVLCLLIDSFLEQSDFLLQLIDGGVLFSHHLSVVSDRIV